jgi:hypothetical protein
LRYRTKSTVSSHLDVNQDIISSLRMPLRSPRPIVRSQPIPWRKCQQRLMRFTSRKLIWWASLQMRELTCDRVSAGGENSFFREGLSIAHSCRTLIRREPEMRHHDCPSTQCVVKLKHTHAMQKGTSMYKSGEAWLRDPGARVPVTGKGKKWHLISYKFIWHISHDSNRLRRMKVGCTDASWFSISNSCDIHHEEETNSLCDN